MSEKNFFEGPTAAEAIAAAPADFQPFARSLFEAMKQTGAYGLLVLVVNADLTMTQSLLIHPEIEPTNPSDMARVLHLLHMVGEEQNAMLADMLEADDPEPGPVS